MASFEVRIVSSRRLSEQVNIINHSLGDHSRGIGGIVISSTGLLWTSKAPRALSTARLAAMIRGFLGNEILQYVGGVQWAYVHKMGIGWPHGNILHVNIHFFKVCHGKFIINHHQVIFTILRTNTIIIIIIIIVINHCDHSYWSLVSSIWFLLYNVESFPVVRHLFWSTTKTPLLELDHLLPYCQGKPIFHFHDFGRKNVTLWATVDDSEIEFFILVFVRGLFFIPGGERQIASSSPCELGKYSYPITQSCEGIIQIGHENP